MQIYPWQQVVYQQIALGQQQHHAVLLQGKLGIGKLSFAKYLAKHWLCSQPQEGAPCGQCDACHWYDEGTHPDFKILEPEEADAGEEGAKKKTTKKTQISIDQVRRLQDELALSNHQAAGTRVVIIQPAEALNQASSNALLKTLEEPPPGTRFILVTHHKHRIMPTILSRCLKVDMPVPTQTQGLAWLKAQAISEADFLWAYSGGAPMQAQSWAQEETQFKAWFAHWAKQLSLGTAIDVAETTTSLLAYGMEQAINVLQKWLHDLWLAYHQQPQRYHPAQQTQLQKLAKSVKLSALLAFQQQLNTYKITAQHPLNQELQLEQLLLQYKKLF